MRRRLRGRSRISVSISCRPLRFPTLSARKSRQDGAREVFGPVRLRTAPTYDFLAAGFAEELPEEPEQECDG